MIEFLAQEITMTRFEALVSLVIIIFVGRATCDILKKVFG
jgi:hypothetical protein